LLKRLCVTFVESRQMVSVGFLGAGGVLEGPLG